MSFDKRMKSVSNLFTASILGLVLATVIGLGLALIYSNVISFRDPIDSNQLHSAVEENEAVRDYLEQEKDYEAHFVTITNLIREEKRQKLTETFITASIPIVILSVGLGYLLSRRLLRPVKESYESQERFIQDAAHELRNPIAAINATLENSTQNLTPTKQKNLIRTIGRQTRRLVRINEDLLYLEKTSTAEKIDEINLSELLEDVIDGFQVNLNQKKIKLKTSISPDVTKRMRATDFIKLSRNLIENAIKYSPKSSTVSIELRKEDKVMLSVVDHGIGIPNEDIDKLGERFFRASNSGEHEGSGLGLAIVGKVINTYGGDIDIQSELNKGTKINVKI